MWKFFKVGLKLWVLLLRVDGWMDIDLCCKMAS